MFSSSKQELFYVTDGDRFEVMIKAHLYRSFANVTAHDFTGWMVDSLPDCQREIIKRVDHFFGDGDFMRWTVTRNELTMIKLAWPIKSRQEWVEEYQKRTQEIMKKIKDDMERILKTSLIHTNEAAWINHTYPQMRLK